MDGAGGTALDWALTLLRTPTERYRLRQRPLPDGVTELLAIAAGAGSDESARAAARLRERPEILCEAARFYTREILFHAQADAYRTLGVALDAPAEQIRQHFRLLQAWLHPDRQDSGDDSVFAARVNAAWNELRSGDRRAAYDARLAAAAAAELGSPVEHPAAVAQLSVALWNPLERSTPQARRRHRIVVAALLGVCGALGWQVIQQSEREPDPWPGEGARPAEARAERPSEPGAVVVQAAARSVASAQVPQAGLPPSPEVFPPLPETAPPPDWPLPDDYPDALPAPVAAVPVRPVAPEVSHSLPPPVAIAPVAESAVRPVLSRPVPPSSGAKPAPADPPAAPVAAPSVAAPAMEPSPAPGHDIPARGDQRSTAPGLAVDGLVDYGHIQKARRVGTQFLDFITSDSGTPPPIWSSAAALDRADGLRRALLRAGAPRLGEPQWRIGRDSAALTSRYSVGGEPRGAVSAVLVWREDRWLVSSVVVEVAP
ncbi:DnaJ domain-containing protein [Thermomonas sp.]|uniref:DnaJ domain-containing protein n=1 Tax=Thermomonas sp. TaxID=1971895 RepID=UPI00261CAD49|nr:DnaJ domain-containing protein [Thermomonas sp.]MCO5054661.1 DnaJ domain-containing protein [Thermomonas sp.]